MKAKFGAIITEGRGKLSGHVFQNGRAGSVMKTKTTPLNKNSQARQKNKAVTSFISQSWSVLTNNQREMWNTEALTLAKQSDFSGKFSISGFALFMKCNTYRIAIGNAITTVPLVSQPFGIFNGFSPYTDVGHTSVFLNMLSLNYVGSTIIIYSSPVMSVGVSAEVKNFKKLGSFFVTGQFLNITSLYLAVYPRVPSSGRTVLKIVFVNQAGYISQEYTSVLAV